MYIINNIQMFSEQEPKPKSFSSYVYPTFCYMHKSTNGVK